MSIRIFDHMGLFVVAYDRMVINMKCAGHAVMLTGESPERTLMAGIS